MAAPILPLAEIAPLLVPRGALIGLDLGTKTIGVAASDPDRAKMLIDRWIAFGYLAGIPLDVEECFDRNIERSLRRYVTRFQDPGTEVTLILPRRHFEKRRHLLLHDRTSRRIARAFAEEAHVDVVVVPFHLGEAEEIEARTTSGQTKA